MQTAIIQTDRGPLTMRSYSMPLADGDAGIRQTVQLMLQKANGPEGAQHPGVRAFALGATRNCPDRDDWQQASAIFRAVKSQIRFRGELDETVQTPWLTLQLGAGDCDDHSTLTVAALKAIGIPARIQTVAVDRARPGVYSHVFALAGVRKPGGAGIEWRALDSTVPWAGPGWQPPRPTRRQVWADQEESTMQDLYGMQGMEGIGGFFKKLFKGSLKAGKVALSAGAGFATGGPAGAVAGATRQILKKHPKAGAIATQALSTGVAGMGAWPPFGAWPRPFYSTRIWRAPAYWNYRWPHFEARELWPTVHFRPFESEWLRRWERHRYGLEGMGSFDSVLDKITGIAQGVAPAVQTFRQQRRAPAPRITVDYPPAPPLPAAPDMMPPAGYGGYDDGNWIHGVPNAAVVLGAGALALLAVTKR